MTPKLYTFPASRSALHEMEQALSASLPSYSRASIKVMAEIGLAHPALVELRKKVARRHPARGRRPTIDLHVLLYDLASAIAEESGTSRETVLRSISGYSEDRKATPDLDLAARAILRAHGLPSFGSLQHQARQALDID
jgi:hypothetical protein